MAEPKYALSRAHDLSDITSDKLDHLGSIFMAIQVLSTHPDNGKVVSNLASCGRWITECVWTDIEYGVGEIEASLGVH
jgi:hypothetical protein